MGLSATPQDGLQPPGEPGANGLRLLLASWGERLGAALIDFIIISVSAMICLGIWVMLVFYVVIRILDDETPSSPLDDMLLPLSLILPLVVIFFLPLMNGILAGTWGRTLGKAAVNLKVVLATNHDRTIGLWRGIGRETLRWLVLILTHISGWSPHVFAVGAVIFLVDHLWPLWDRNNQTLHDKVVRSHVVVTGRS